MNAKPFHRSTSFRLRGSLSLGAIVLGFGLVATPPIQGASGESAVLKVGSGEALRAAASDGTLAFRLSTPEELERLLGKPQNQRAHKDGDMTFQILEYPGVIATFGRIGEFSSPFTLFELRVEGQAVDIGRERQLVLRTVEDLGKLDFFWGVSGVSLAKLDLRDQLKALSKLTFDTRTVWPAADKLPVGFDPVRLLEEGKNPGLGVRNLHAAGIDGSGVGIAIMDQPLLREHEEYKDRIMKYTEVDVEGVPPQMHGAAVASIAVGKTCGVAPGATLYYFATPSWKWSRNEPWAEQLERIIELNRSLTNAPPIRVVSLSLGAFSERPNYTRWQQAVKKAEESGILVVTCDPDFLRIATLKRVESRPDPTATDYGPGVFAHPSAALCVPAANRTLASFRGPVFYTYDRTGGMSWTVPYLAGVAALGWQVDPSIKPREMVELWKHTAVKTETGSVIDPVAFVEAIRRQSKRG
jgi:hypothetical protein